MLQAICRYSMLPNLIYVIRTKLIVCIILDRFKANLYMYYIKKWPYLGDPSDCRPVS